MPSGVCDGVIIRSFDAGGDYGNRPGSPFPVSPSIASSSRCTVLALFGNESMYSMNVTDKSTN